MRYGNTAHTLVHMTKHEFLSLIVAFWPIWVGLFVSLVVLRFEDPR